MFLQRLMGNYILVKKSSVLFGMLLAVGLVGYHFYKYHRAELKRDIEQFTDDVADTAKKGARRVKEVADEAKS